MSGVFEFPLNLLDAIALIIDQGVKLRHDGHGLSNFPSLVCHAFDLVSSSSGRVFWADKGEMVAA